MVSEHLVTGEWRQIVPDSQSIQLLTNTHQKMDEDIKRWQKTTKDNATPMTGPPSRQDPNQAVTCRNLQDPLTVLPSRQVKQRVQLPPPLHPTDYWYIHPA